MRLVPLAALLLASAPALACSCAPPGPDGPKVAYLVLATVEEAVRTPDGTSALTTLRVEKRYIGKTPARIRVQTGTSPSACGIEFKPGQRQLFALRRTNGVYATSLCLMQKAHL